MGLESHIRQVIEDEPASGLRFGWDYWFDDGLTCKDASTAERVVEQLYESDQFGYMTLYSQLSGEVKIVFEPLVKKKCIDCGGAFFPPHDRPKARKCNDCYWAPVGP